MDDRRFESLARGLAQGMSRRQALKAVLVAATGGVLIRAGLDPTEVSAANGPADAACIKYCFQAYKGNSKDIATCVQEVVKGQGPCCSPGGNCTNNFSNCGTNSNCFCFTSAEGNGVCGCNTYCNQASSCTKSSDCPSGYVCIVSNGCSGCSGSSGVCVAICAASHGTCSLSSDSIHGMRVGVTPLTAISRA